MKKQSAVLDVLVEKRQLDVDTWLRIIEARVNDSIKPNLDRFTLWKIGDIQVYGPKGRLGCSDHLLSEDAPRFLTEGYTAKTQGLFYVAPGEDKTRRHEYAFGLTREGNWVIVTIQLEDCGRREHWAGWRGRERIIEARTYYRATEVTVEPSDLREICSRFWWETPWKTPEKGCSALYSLLNSAVYSWQSRLREAYQQAAAAIRQIEFEQELLDLITKSDGS